MANPICTKSTLIFLASMSEFLTNKKGPYLSKYNPFTFISAPAAGLEPATL